MRASRQVGDTDKVNSTGKWVGNPLFTNVGTASFKSVVTKSVFFSAWISISVSANVNVP